MTNANDERLKYRGVSGRLGAFRCRVQDEEGRKNTAEEEISVTPFHYSSQKGHRGEMKSGDGETNKASPTPKDGEQQEKYGDLSLIHI